MSTPFDQQLYNYLDSNLADIERGADSLEGNVFDALDEAQETIDAQRAIRNNIAEQDYQIGMHMIVRYYNTEFESEEELERTEDHIDALFARNDYTPPFDGAGIPRVDLSENEYEPSGFIEKI